MSKSKNLCLLLIKLIKILIKFCFIHLITKMYYNILPGFPGVVLPDSHNAGSEITGSIINEIITNWPLAC